MMDLDEARASLEFYANLLDSQCEQYGLVVGLVEAGQNAAEADPRATDLKDRVVTDLRRTEKEALVLSILVEEEIARETRRLAEFPTQLVKFLEARNRKTAALNRASALLREHDQREAARTRKEAEKNTTNKPTPTQIAIQEFLKNNLPKNNQKTLPRSKN